MLENPLIRILGIPVYSYGLMLGIAFLVGSWLFSKELKRLKIDENFGVMITFLAIIGGLIGSKLFYIIEIWNFGTQYETNKIEHNPLSHYIQPEYLFTPSGLTFYGGLVLSFILILWYCKKKKLSFMQILDTMSPAAAIAYGIARIGCHLSGDGCYGINVNGTFWQFLGCSYSKGIIKPDQGVIPLATPIIEFVASVFIFVALWLLRKNTHYFGQLFYYYLLFSGLERLLIEFVRTNPTVILNLTQAQLISIIMIIIGLIMIIIKRNKNEIAKE